MTHLCVSKLTSIASDNGLSPGRRQAIIWNNAGILLIGPLGTNFSGILIEIQIFSLKKIRLKMSSAKCRPFCLGLNVLNASAISLSKIGPTAKWNVHGRMGMRSYWFENIEEFWNAYMRKWTGSSLFQKWSVATVEFGDGISSFITHFTVHIITYPCWR